MEFISIVERLKTAAGNFVILLILKPKCQFSTNSKNTTFTVLPHCLSWGGAGGAQRSEVYGHVEVGNARGQCYLRPV